jgi:hypothetical protein
MAVFLFNLTGAGKYCLPFFLFIQSIILFLSRAKQLFNGYIKFVIYLFYPSVQYGSIF